MTITEAPRAHPHLVPRRRGGHHAGACGRSAFVGIRHVAHDISPGHASAPARLLVAALVVLPLVLRRGSGAPPTRPASGSCSPPAASAWFGIYNLALNEAERRIDAGTAALIIQIGPIIVALLAAWSSASVLTTRGW